MEESQTSLSVVGAGWTTGSPSEEGGASMGAAAAADNLYLQPVAVGNLLM